MNRESKELLTLIFIFSVPLWSILYPVVWVRLIGFVWSFFLAFMVAFATLENYEREEREEK